MVKGHDGQEVRLVLIPKFCETGEVVLVNTKSFECKVVNFALAE